MSEQKLREALDCICSAKLCSINSMSSRVEMLMLMDLAIDKLREALAAPAGEQVGLTDEEIVLLMNYGYGCRENDQQDHIMFARAVIATHEAKRVSCSQTAKKSTHEVGRVDETEKNEQVGGAA